MASPPLGPLVSTSPAPFPVSCLIEGVSGRLRPLSPQADGPELFRLSHGAEKEAIWAYLPPPPFADEAAFIAHMKMLIAREDLALFGIVDPQDRPLGWFQLMRIEPAHRVVEIGYVLYTPPLQRTRLGTEAVFLIARHVFETLGYRRFEWKCNALNAPSKAAAERYGFAYEGRFRQHMIVKGHSRDTDWYAMLDSDWPKIKAGFTAWLAPDNFDGEGRQKTRLNVKNA